MVHREEVEHPPQADVAHLPWEKVLHREGKSDANVPDGVFNIQYKP